MTLYQHRQVKNTRSPLSSVFRKKIKSVIFLRKHKLFLVNGLNSGVWSISSLSSVIVRVGVALKRTVGDSDWRFDNLSGSNLQSQSDIVSSVDGIYVSGY